MFDSSDAKDRTCHFGLILAMNILGGTLRALLSGLFQDALDINAVFDSIMIHPTSLQLHAFDLTQKENKKRIVQSVLD